MHIEGVDGVDCPTALLLINTVINYHTATARTEFMTAVALRNFTKTRVLLLRPRRRISSFVRA